MDSAIHRCPILFAHCLAVDLPRGSLGISQNSTDLGDFTPPSFVLQWAIDLVLRERLAMLAQR